MLGSINCLCTDHERTFRLFAKVYTKGVVDIAVWCLKLWQIMTYSFIGMAGLHNNINMLQRSLIFSKLVEGYAPPCNYEINGHHPEYQFILAFLTG
jgi:hypothetical protein